MSVSSRKAIGRKNRRSGDFLYKFICEDIRIGIFSGKYLPRSRLPSADEFARMYSVNRLTVRKAFSCLAAEALIFTRPAQGTYVADSPQEAVARRNAAPRTRSVGIVSRMILTGSVGSYHSAMLAGIHRELIGNRTDMVLLPFRGTEDEKEMFRHAANAGLDALIYVGPFGKSALRIMVEKSAPSVILDFQMRDSGTDCIVMDNCSGGYMAVRHLASLGHRDIAIVTGDMAQPAAKERLEGAMLAAVEKGIPESSVRVVEGRFTEESGYNAVAGILKSGKVPRAIFFMNDEMAVGGIRAFHGLSKLKIPQDVSVIGFDNSACSMMTVPRLTTIAAPAAQMGRFAVQRLFERIRGEDYSPSMTQMDVSLVERESCRPKG